MISLCAWCLGAPVPSTLHERPNCAVHGPAETWLEEDDNAARDASVAEAGTIAVGILPVLDPVQTDDSFMSLSFWNPSSVLNMPNSRLSVNNQFSRMPSTSTESDTKSLQLCMVNWTIHLIIWYDDIGLEKILIFCFFVEQSRTWLVTIFIYTIIQIS